MSVSSNREFTSDFLGFINLGVNRMAQDIVNGLVQLFHACGLGDEWKTKLVSVCTDGAAVNVGSLQRGRSQIASDGGNRGFPCAYSVYRPHP